jgi:hypothetical protein
VIQVESDFVLRWRESNDLLVIVPDGVQHSTNFPGIANEQGDSKPHFARKCCNPICANILTKRKLTLRYRHCKLFRHNLLKSQNIREWGTKRPRWEE